MYSSDSEAFLPEIHLFSEIAAVTVKPAFGTTLTQKLPSELTMIMSRDFKDQIWELKEMLNLEEDLFKVLFTCFEKVHNLYDVFPGNKHQIEISFDCIAFFVF